MLLVYPKMRIFLTMLGPFEFCRELKLWAVQFDSVAGQFVEEGMPDDLKPVVGSVPWAEPVN